MAEMKPDELELHSPLGPSASERWLNCPGSVLLTKDMPDTSSEFAIEGTAAHLVSEWVRDENRPAKDYLGTEVPVHVEDGAVRHVVCDQEMVDGVQAFVDYVSQFDGESFHELRVHYDAWVPDGFGTADDIRIADGMCYLTDLKYGKGIQVYANRNPQLMMYALGVFQELGHLYEIDCFQLNIFQPRLDHIDECTLSCRDILLWAQQTVQPTAEIALKPDAPFKAGDWCQFCAAKHVCRTRQKAMFELTVGEMSVLDDEPSPRDVMLMDNAELAEVLPYIDQIRKWCNDVEAQALSEIQKGHPVGDYKLVEGRSIRAWKNDEEAEAAFRAGKVKVGDMFIKKLWSPAQAEKVLGKGHPLIEANVHKPPGKPKLAAGDDPRPELKTSADEMEALDSETQ